MHSWMLQLWCDISLRMCHVCTLLACILANYLTNICLRMRMLQLHDKSKLTSMSRLFIHACRWARCRYIGYCLCVCTFTDFFAEDNASGVIFCTAVHRRPRQGMSHFCELCSPRSPKSDEMASARATPSCIFRFCAVR